jgi:hypothetical protein
MPRQHFAHFFPGGTKPREFRPITHRRGTFHGRAGLAMRDPLAGAAHHLLSPRAC